MPACFIIFSNLSFQD
uniref:Uncharacterized protein n=1 Tax=Arundo donax TaxID=35708 RepID=A0A0A9HRS7_ARUDO